MIYRTVALFLAVAILPRSYQEYQVIPGKFAEFAVDQQGNTIAADASGTLYKWNAAAQLLATQAYANHGGNPWIDASNGLQVLVYYPSSRHLLMLDNQLNQRRIVDFNSLENYQIKGLGFAADGNFWLLDARDGFLHKLNYDGRVLAETMLLGDWLPSGRTRIYDDGEHILLGTAQDPLIRVLTATLNRKMLLSKPAGYWDARDGELVYALDSQRLILEPYGVLGKRDTARVEGAGLQRFRLLNAGLVNLAGDGLHLYR